MLIFAFNSFSNGPDWARLRTKFQQALSKPQNVKNYIPASDDILRDFMVMIRRRASNAPAEDFLQELSRVSLECNINFPFIQN
jgi:cytochrome P450